MGLTPAREGSIAIFGQDTTRWPTFRIAAQDVGYVPEGRRIFVNLSVEGKSESPAGARGAVDRRAHLPAVSALRGAQAQPWPTAFRGRTGDAVDCPRAAD
jgi:ABC-type branched-subunit amino acid transport system ATPase component